MGNVNPKLVVYAESLSKLCDKLNQKIKIKYPNGSVHLNDQYYDEKNCDQLDEAIYILNGIDTIAHLVSVEQCEHPQTKQLYYKATIDL